MDGYTISAFRPFTDVSLGSLVFEILTHAGFQYQQMLDDLVQLSDAFASQDRGIRESAYSCEWIRDGFTMSGLTD